MAKDEPQSYGSQGDWLEGNVEEEVNPLKANPNSQLGDFYEHQGGEVSPAQLAENVEPVGPTTDVPQPQAKVSSREQGAKRRSFFKDRDYK